MPLFDYKCVGCEETFESLQPSDRDVIFCPKCKQIAAIRQLSAPSFRMTGSRAANGYGAKFIDTPGRHGGVWSSGYSFHSNRGGQVEADQGK